ncbi:MAG: 3-hydroxyisobutyrate dehydrogenase-like beta-hydroxyacid dehydrogenase [Paracoccaceae bacterium]
MFTKLRVPLHLRKRQIEVLIDQKRGAAMTELRTGFIGLGTMGAWMCGHLIAAGVQTTVWARSRDKAQALLAKGANWADSPRALAEGCDVVMLCVSNDDAVGEVVFGENGIVAATDAAQVLVDHSSIHPMTTRDWAQKLRSQCGTGWIDAPVSGGPGGAERGELIVMAGGTAADFAIAEPLVSAYAKQITLMGPCGAGQATKACNQLIIGAEICAIAEALSFAKNFGMDAHALADALKGGWADSPVLQDHGRRMANADYSDPADASMMLKDMGIAQDMGNKTGSAMPVTDLVTALFNKAIDEGHMDGGQIAPMRLYSSEPL